MCPITEELNYEPPMFHRQHSEKESEHAAKHEASQAGGKALLTLRIAIQVFAATLEYFSWHRIHTPSICVRSLQHSVFSCLQRIKDMSLQSNVF